MDIITPDKRIGTIAYKTKATHSVNMKWVAFMLTRLASALSTILKTN